MDLSDEACECLKGGTYDENAVFDDESCFDDWLPPPIGLSLADLDLPKLTHLQASANYQPHAAPLSCVCFSTRAEYA